jgi:hypothetical protein
MIVNKNSPAYIHFFFAFFLIYISSGVKNDNYNPSRFGSWLAWLAPLALRHHLSMILPFIQNPTFSVSTYYYKA